MKVSAREDSDAMRGKEGKSFSLLDSKKWKLGQDGTDAAEKQSERDADRASYVQENSETRPATASES